MKMPSMPQKGEPVEPTVRRIIECLKSLRITSVVGGQVRQSSGGTTIVVNPSPPAKLAEKIDIPFDVSSSIGESEENLLSVLGGAWQEGATGAWTTIGATAATAGEFAYLVIEQDSDRAITSVSISIEATALDPVVVSGGGTATSNVLLAEMLTVGDETKVVQRRHGNFTIGLWQIDGDVVRWPETLVGTIPTPEPPP